MAFTTSTFLSDSIKFIRDFLDDTLTDPISSKRAGRDRFVMTSYPDRPVKYPIITVKKSSMSTISRSGQQSEGVWQGLIVEVRVWSKSETQKDKLTEQVFNALRSNQFGTGGSVEFELHDFMLLSSVPIEEDGEDGLKSEVMEYQYRLEII